MLCKRRTFWLLFIAAALILTGCGQTLLPSKNDRTTGLKPLEGGTFRFGMINSPVSLDPAFLGENNAIEIGKELYDGLVSYDPQTLEIRPAIAEDWNYSEDKRTITFHIRKDVKFHDGTIVKVQDIIDDWNRLAAKDTASPVVFPLEPIVGFKEVNSGSAQSLSGLKKIDDYTLEVTLSQPDAAFLSSLGYPAAGIYKVAGMLNEGKNFDSSAATPETFIGTGAFKFEKWTANKDVTLIKFNDYYGSKAHVNKVVYKIFPDETTALNDFCAGNLDYVDRIPAGQEEAIINEFPGQTLSKASLTAEYIGFNLKTAPFKDNLNLRKAVAYALDVRKVIETFRQDNSTASLVPMPAEMPGFDQDLRPLGYDKNKAREYLAKAGYPNGKGLPVIQYLYNSTELNQKVAEAFQAQLNEVGIKIELKNLEWDSYLKALQAGESSMFRLSRSADYPDPDNFLRVLYSKAQWGINNYTFYANSEVETWLAQGLIETDPLKRQRIYRAVQEKVLADQPAVWVSNTTYLKLYGKDVHSLTVNSLDQKDLRSVWLSRYA